MRILIQPATLKRFTQPLASTLRRVADHLDRIPHHHEPAVPPKAQRISDFDPATLPWIDRPNPDIAGYVQRVKAQGMLPTEYDLEKQLTHWRESGYVVFAQAAPSKLIDALLADIGDAFERASTLSLMVGHEERGMVPISKLSPQDLNHPYYRLCDFHNHSIAGKLLALNPTVLSFLGHVFADRVVAMQSLTFMKGSGQSTHQDYAYVVAKIVSHLAAAWIALEDVHPDSGPLGYYPGSHHKVRKFDFGNGMFLTPESPLKELHFAAHIETECQLLGIEQQRFFPKKGDIFIWHGALAHRGTPVKNKQLTRKSFVVHYSSQLAYPEDRRAPGKAPMIYERNGGMLYKSPLAPHEEDILRRGQAFL